ncbi:hypothetical protein AJ80_07298 [Polytolypa hystricis UAMH7299]|uniref:DUF292 domain-containing protein n=1 Tax=Polytolypa hystricis (strain UAMH7299) TaxID=1447883 RepID=A0A2B7XQV4_POLH7|nr:hypothetical protein AJ80_07298 [Polytolypa hystricis UAMH7299]
MNKKQTELIFALRALIYRLRQLKKERRGYSKGKHRELAKLLKEGREDLARIKTEDVIGNDNFIAALEIIELYCEQLHVRANILDHLAFGERRNSVLKRGGGKRPGSRSRGERRASAGAGVGVTATSASTSTNGSGGWGAGLWKALGFSMAEMKAPNAGGEEQQQQSTPQDKNLPHSPPEEAEAEEEDERDIYIDPELDLAAAVIFYSYTRIPRDIPGLLELRAKLIHRWGNDFAIKAQDGDESIVKLPEELVDRLQIRKAPEVLVERYLKEIARSHGLAWGQEDDDEGRDEGDHGEEEKEERPPEYSASGPKGTASGGVGKVDELLELRKSAPPPNSTIAAREENDISPPRTTSPGISDVRKGPGPSEEKTGGGGGGIPEVDELARRFAALKR